MSLYSVSNMGPNVTLPSQGRWMIVAAGEVKRRWKARWRFDFGKKRTSLTTHRLALLQEQDTTRRHGRPL